MPSITRLASTIPPATAPLDLATLVGAAGWARLPAAVQRRFAAAHADCTYRGRLDLRCSRAGRVFALLARAFGGPLAAVDATAVQATVRVHADGRGGVVWERRFHCDPANDHLVCSTKELDAGGGLRERVAGGLGMALDVFEEGGALVFQSRHFVLLAGSFSLRLPTLLSPGTCRVTHADLGGGRFRFSLDMVHPWWGRTFHQSGVFADPIESDAA
jgi:hypothetical protein